MHEMGLAEGILDVVLDAAGEQKVAKIRLHIGRMQMVVPDSLKFSFELVSADTPAAEAAIEIEELPAVFACRSCSSKSEIASPPFVCAECGSADLELISGDEVSVDEVELASGVVLRRLAVDAEGILEEHIREHHADDPHHRHHPHPHDHDD
ncbi:MAG: hydrogenase maturation nickel metallochaperone HypA/HybF [Deltaproteobacteria bacterium]